METDSKDDAPKKTRKVKKQVRKGDLPIVSGTSSLDGTSKIALTEKESSMVMEDKLVADTEEKKNELETYIYDLRAKLDDQYSDFASEDEKTTIKAKLEATEVWDWLHFKLNRPTSFFIWDDIDHFLQDWLYDEGDDASKGVYVAKIDEIRAMAGPIVQRHFEKVDADRRAVQERVEAEQASKRAAEEESRKAEAEKAAQAGSDQEMKDANAPQAEIEEAGDPK